MSTKSPTSVDAYVGQRIRRRRLEMQIGQEQLADESGVTFQQIQKYEKGVNRVGAGRLIQFANILKVPVAFFFEGAPGYDLAVEYEDKFAHLLAHKEAQQLLEIFSAMGLEQQRALVALARTINIIADQPPPPRQGRRA